MYLDTNVVLWLVKGSLNRMSARTLEAVEDSQVLLSPMVLLELEYLHEIGRGTFSSQVIQLKLEHELGARVCELPFATVSQVALGEKWTRDPFDRMIVAQAKARGLAPLITADERIREHYSAVLW